MYNNNPFESGNSDNNYNPFETEVKKKKHFKTNKVEASQSNTRNTIKRATVKSNSRKPKEKPKNKRSNLNKLIWWVLLILLVYWS